MENSAKFNLISGKNYQVINSKFISCDGMISSNSTHEFLTSFACYDVRYHGIANPDDFILYIFKLPEKFGQISFYQFQILQVLEA
jgi:hypothetical protein